MVEVHLLITGHTFPVAHTHTTNNRLPWNRKRFHTGNPPHLALTHHSGGRVGTVRERHNASTHDALVVPVAGPQGVLSPKSGQSLTPFSQPVGDTPLPAIRSCTSVTATQRLGAALQ